MNILFYAKFGPHAALEKEIWYYFGIINNSFQISHADPTYWIIKSLEFIPSKFWFCGLILIASLLSSFTAVLISLLGARIFGIRLGFYAGLIYAFLLGPFEMSLANFTHDVVAMPVIIILFLVTLSLIGSRGYKRFIFAAVFLMLTYIGLQVGPLIIIGVCICLFYILLSAVKEKYRLIVFCLMLVFVFLIRAIFSSNILHILNQFSNLCRGIDIVSQVKAHARDLMPIKFGSLFIRSNVWIALCFVGLVYCQRKKIEYFSLIIFSVGLIFVFAFSRVARIFDIGLALLASYAFSYSRLDKRPLLIIAIFSILTMLFCYSSVKSSTTETEYQTFLWLKEYSKKHEKVLIPWDYGYFLKSVSGKDPSSTPENINFSLHQVYWKPIEEAYQILKASHIRFVCVSNKYFGISYIDPQTDDFYYGGDGSLIYRPEEAGIKKFSQLQKTFLFMLMDNPEVLRDFELIREARDMKTNLYIRIYKVKGI